tara:strand:- start:854 stop:1138 length:285 start_codon:yes stop_codon:yes gene_type:complete
MGKRKDLFLFLGALLFTSLVSLEPLTHDFEQKDSIVHEYECEYCENHNSVEPLNNEANISSFLIENTYLFNLYIHISLLEKPFLSRAPPKNKVF